MDSIYSTSQPYSMYEQHHWNDEAKTTYIADEHDHGLVDKSIDSAHAITSSSIPSSRRPSVLKVEDEFSAAAPVTAPSSHIWHDRSHDSHPVRSFSSFHPPTMDIVDHQYMRVNDPTFTASMQQAHMWSVPHSGASTPTPMYSQVYDMPYTHPAPGFATYAHDPTSAVSMSPQSSQGGWASTTSSDGTDQRGLISPTYRAPSPGSVVRPDGIRKKNARFEIPKERNLANIDAMILASTDETEKKELKQQKRLLRNRQAALDSRQRKKTHTEKLEQEKKVSEKKMFDLEEAAARLENTLALEREQFLQQRQHLENIIHALQYDRDEAIRTKTLETTELRRQNNMLKDCVRDLERQQQEGYGPASQMNHYDDEFEEFGLDDSWDDEFNLASNDDLRMDDSDASNRQTTPRPPTSMVKSLDVKPEAGFSWATFYMCLLFGAFIASNNNGKTLDNTAASAIASSIPPAEANNVIKTVLSSKSTASDVVPSHSEARMNSVGNGGGDIRSTHLDVNTGPSTTLDHLHQSLATPSRRQEMAAAFSMSASSYQHLTDPFNEHLNPDPEHSLLDPAPAPQPTALQKAFATMQAQKDDIDKLTGMGSKARERSLLWDQVPPEVIKNFEAMVHGTANSNNNNNDGRMEQ